MVAPEGCEEDDDVQNWVQLGMDFAATLPAKEIDQTIKVFEAREKFNREVEYGGKESIISVEEA